ncbi:LOB domain-containing protein 24-like [Lotus japonicus]|uniref:LOB domain-containing protein 24-like n=1 Tax=Lotus japonicus TaxID=34305 RepID=UPI00258BD60D|nr:LOB domain-containing protein 24-like [Lotus japonicus]
MISGRCAACKNQRRKCPSDCIFSPYFPPNDPQRYLTVHRIYGGSNVGRMLQKTPPYVRARAADCLYYEAQCRIEDPVYGCFGIISQLVQQIHNTQSELTKTQAQINILEFQTPQVEMNSSIEQFQASWFE